MPRLKKEDIRKLYEGYITASEAESMGAEGGAFTREEAVSRYLARRAEHDYKQAGRVELGAQRETGITKRQGMIETGELEQQKRKQEFARPLQAAQIGSYKAGTTLAGAQTAEARRKTTAEGLFTPYKERELGRMEEADILSGKVLAGKNRATLAEQEKANMDINAPAPATPTIPTTAGVAKPRRKLRPWIKKEIYGSPSSINPLASAAYGYRNIADWLKFGLGEAYNYARPRR